MARGVNGMCPDGDEPPWPMISSTWLRTASSEMFERFEGLGGDALALVDEAEEDVLGADVVVVQEACFLLRQHDDPAGPVGEAFEQLDRLYGWTDTWSRVYRPAPRRHGLGRRADDLPLTVGRRVTPRPLSEPSTTVA